MEGVSVVFYTESMASFPRDFFSYYTIIVQGNFSSFNKILWCNGLLDFILHFILYLHPHCLPISGAKNVIKACRECKVKHLIYNSSADVVFDGSRNICNVDESLPYPNQVCFWLDNLRFCFFSTLRQSFIRFSLTPLFACRKTVWEHGRWP